MTAKEKAKSIFFTIINIGKGLTSDFHSKQCAIACVDEILSNGGTEYHNKYWQNVKTEIQNL